jgi:hypothetical protein
MQENNSAQPATWKMVVKLILLGIQTLLTPASLLSCIWIFTGYLDSISTVSLVENTAS